MPARDDYCDVCYKRLPRSRLVRKRYTTQRSPGSNLLKYSSYDSSYWTVTAGTYAGNTACGLQRGYVKVASDNTTSIAKGSPEFTGAKVGIRSGSIDASGASSVLFSVYVGVEPGSSILSVTLTIADAVTPANYLTKKVTAKTPAGRRYWMQATASELSTAGVDISAFTVEVEAELGDAADNAWIDGAQVETDATGPGRLIITTGSAVQMSERTVQSGMAVMCPECAARMRPVKSRTRRRVILPKVDAPVRTRLE